MPSTTDATQRDLKRAVEEARRLRKALEIATEALRWYAQATKDSRAAKALRDIAKGTQA